MAEKNEYTPSQKVKELEAAVQAQKEARPGEYKSGWDRQMQDVMERILNREPFRYQLNGDALYRQYRDQAVQNGKRAMMDTMGQAAAMTGGYGNTYAQYAGQQAYQQQMERLNDRIPELYALALEQYRTQTQGLQDQYSLLSDAEKRDYARYQDSLAAWQREADALWQNYTDQRGFDYGIFRDQTADSQWQSGFDESKRRYDQEWDTAHPPQSGSSYSGGGTAKKKSPMDDVEKIKAAIRSSARKLV